MKLLNLGCGDTRPKGEHWTNLDDLHAQLPLGEASRANLDAENNYVNFDVLSGPLPFPDGTFDGILASHFFEHFDAQQAVAIMEDCHRVLCHGGVLYVSVPDASYFRSVYNEDRNENWARLFDTTDPVNPIPTFFRAALWFEQHKALFTTDVLWCYLTRAAFLPETHIPHARLPILAELENHLNRRKFSVEMYGVRP